ncbi:peptidase M4 [bacterium]|nr:peptidase M4 [bacterium]
MADYFEATARSEPVCSAMEQKRSLDMDGFLHPLADGQRYPAEGTAYQVSRWINRAQVRPYEPAAGEPRSRPLQIFAVDPSLPRHRGAIATVQVPYEPLQPGPTGMIFETTETSPRTAQADLDNPMILLRNGYAPSPSQVEFHKQMVYAVCSLTYAKFQRALGRFVGWGFERSGDLNCPQKLRLRPHCSEERNAYYDRTDGSLNFGYYTPAPEETSDRNVPGATVFTCLSHDVIAHEMTHALLDGLRSSFAVISHPDVAAFHESFADLVAIFQRFSYRDVVEAAMAEARGNLAEAELLTEIARQFGNTVGLGGALRTTLDKSEPPKRYEQVSSEPHALSTILTTAVFEAFQTIFKRKARPYVRLATGGTGVLPPGHLPGELLDILTSEVSKLADQFLNICIRAIDYCPPVDIELGEFLRAVITADYELVPEDPWGYREAWIDAFRRRGIFPSGVDFMAEDALLWRPPLMPLPIAPALDFAHLAFHRSPAQPADRRELRRQACALGWYVTRSPECLAAFGCLSPQDPAVGRRHVTMPEVQSIRSAQRIGPDGQIVYDLVAEITQRRLVPGNDAIPEFEFYGGSTVIIDAEGMIRYVIVKNIDSTRRQKRQMDFLRTEYGSHFWQAGDQGCLKPQLGFFGHLTAI